MCVKCVHTQTTQYLLDVALISFAHLLSSVENGPRVGMNVLCHIHCSFLCVNMSNKVEDGDISCIGLNYLALTASWYVG